MSAICMWAVFDMHDLHSFTFELLSVTKSYSRKQGQDVERQSANCSASIYAQALLALISLSRPSPSYPVVCRNFHTLSQSAEPTQPDRRTILKMTSDVLQTRWLQRGYKVSRRCRSRPSHQTKRCISTIRRAAAMKKGPRWVRRKCHHRKRG
jgi:hypothetical protein